MALRTDDGRTKAGHSVRLEQDTHCADIDVVHVGHFTASFSVPCGHQVLCVSNFDDRVMVRSRILGKSTGSGEVLVLTVQRCFALRSRLQFHFKLTMDLGHRWTD